MNGKWTADEVRELMLKIAGAPISVTQRVELFDIASNYASLLEQIERAREGVTSDLAATVLETYIQIRVDADDPREDRVDRVAAMQEALQAIAHLLPSERGVVDESAEVRLGEYLKYQAGYACLNDQSRRNIANTFLAVAYPTRPPAQVAGVNTVRPWPKFVQDECLEVLRNMDTELGATGRKSARIERLINAIAGMPTAEPVAQGATGYVPLTIVQTICNSLRQRGDYLSISAATQLERLSAQPASQEKPVGRQREAPTLRQWRPKGRDNWKWNDFDPQTTDDEIERYREKYDYRELFTHPAAPVGVSDAWPKLELWFFRELSDAQRLSLLKLHGFPVDEIGQSLQWQKRALRQLLAAAPSAPQEKKACTRNCDCVGPCKMGLED